MRRAPHLVIGVVLLGTAACAVPQKRPTKPPVVPDFTFSPPSTLPSGSSMTVALIKPQTSGSMFAGMVLAENPGDIIRVQTYVDDLLRAAKTDMEKILVSKGFKTLGPFETIDEMTYSQKEQASLIYAPIFEAAMDFQGSQPAATAAGRVTQNGTVLVRGSVSLAFKEPLTSEKLWLKRFDLEPFSAPYTVTVQTRQQTLGDAVVNAALGLDQQQPENTQAEAVVTTLNQFYKAAMSKMWEHLDPREIEALRGDAEKLKKLKRF